ncbi:hypothetical protein DPX16_17352 [Anabarilius grahami]|uniref:Uncharacterized protein n=1 Tax=Anabarilius grahami TaxID=495550 RepID=A0A3N0XYQ8_ANAGA|nr:hypothetical protein DPX16_17352 [Anabarilius grahami]
MILAEDCLWDLRQNGHPLERFVEEFSHQSRNKMVAILEPRPKMVTIPEPRPNMAAIPEPCPMIPEPRPPNLRRTYG